VCIPAVLLQLANGRWNVFKKCTYCHGQQTRLVVLQIEVLIRELLDAVDCSRAGAIPIDEVAALDHEAFDLSLISPITITLHSHHLTTRWNLHPLYPCGCPRLVFVSPVQNCRKFSAVLGTIFLNNSILILPSFSPVCLCQSFVLGMADHPRPR
jgi:hypothetical protein